jgi:hypothetical protein
MADLFAASIQHRQATGTHAGQRLLRLRHAPPRPFPGGLEARSHGFELHGIDLGRAPQSAPSAKIAASTSAVTSYGRLWPPNA